MRLVAEVILEHTIPDKTPQGCANEQRLELDNPAPAHVDQQTRDRPIHGLARYEAVPPCEVENRPR